MSDSRKRVLRTSPSMVSSNAPRRQHAVLCAVLVTVASICLGYTIVANMNTYYYSSSEQIAPGGVTQGAEIIHHFYAHLQEHNKEFTPQDVSDVLFGTSSNRKSVTLFSNRSHHPLLQLLQLLLPSVQFDASVCSDITAGRYNATSLYIVDCEYGVRSSDWEHIYSSYDSAVTALLRLTAGTSQVLFLSSLPARPQSTDLKELHDFLLTKYIASQPSLRMLPEYNNELLFPPDQHPLHSQMCSACLRLLLFIKQAVHDSLPVYTKTSDATSLSAASLHLRCHKLLNTRKYDANCFPKPEKLIPLLVTSLGGAGTHYSTLTLWKMGLEIKHENIDADGGVAWAYAVNDIYSNTVYPRHSSLAPLRSSVLTPRFQYVLHVIRCPSKHISAFTSHDPKSLDFVLKVMRESNDTYANSKLPSIVKRKSQFRGDHYDPLPFAALTWVYWNQHIHTYADFTLQAESTGDELKRICVEVFGEERCSAMRDGSSDSHEDKANDNPGFWSWITGSYSSHEAKSWKKSGYTNHRHHKDYKIRDIEAFDKELANRIRMDASLYGFNASCLE